MAVRRFAGAPVTAAPGDRLVESITDRSICGSARGWSVVADSRRSPCKNHMLVSLPPSAAQATRLARPLRVVVSTGDVSGEMHAAALVRALRAAARAAGVSLEVVACGAQGGALSEAGASIIADTGGTRCAKATMHVCDAMGRTRSIIASLWPRLVYVSRHSSDLCYDGRQRVRFWRLTPPLCLFRPQ